MAAAVAMLGGCAGTGGANLPVVAGVDLDRYAGRWHEVAAMPAWFQRKCASDTTADYAPTPDGRITVVNRCREADGSTREATGVARPTGTPGEGKLEVSFLSVFGIPIWPAAGDYWIIALDPDYRWSVVGHPSREYGWILSRTPTLPAATLRELRGRLAAAGYDTCKLVVTQDAAKPRLCDV
ncbi:hypothetical protein STHU_35540 [Allostella humosa]|nr:hypothetical protein STHU_35540 [Stella humosa]